MFCERQFHSGRVKSWSKITGYGFIEPTDSMEIFARNGKKQDVFVHFSSISGHGVKNLYCGQEVKFKYYLSDRGSGFTAYIVEPLTAWWEALMPLE